jgi:hypothetical protein
MIRLKVRIKRFLAAWLKEELVSYLPSLPLSSNPLSEFDIVQHTEVLHINTNPMWGNPDTELWESQVMNAKNRICSIIMDKYLQVEASDLTDTQTRPGNREIRLSVTIKRPR